MNYVSEEQNDLHEHEDEIYHWYVLGLAKNREDMLRRSLSAFADAHPTKILDIYLPTQTLSSWKNNKKVTKEIPSVPGYLFVKAAEGYLDTKEIKLQIQTGYRIVGTITDEKIQEMKIEFSNVKEINEFELKVGSKVRINKGSFIGLSGKVDKIGANGSVTIKVWLMHGCEPTEIDVQSSDVGPIEDEREEL